MAQLVDINIAGRTYQVACREGEEENLRAAARLVDGKSREALAGLGTLSEARQFLFASLLLADQLLLDARKPLRLLQIAGVLEGDHDRPGEREERRPVLIGEGVAGLMLGDRDMSEILRASLQRDPRDLPSIAVYLTLSDRLPEGIPLLR